MTDFFNSKDEAMKWILSFLACPDSLTTSSFHKFFAEDVRTRFANNEEIVGLEALKGFFEPQFPGLESMKHVVNELDLAPAKLLVDLHITYVLKGDQEHKKIKVAAFGVTSLRKATVEEIKLGGDGARIERFSVWVDAAPVAERAKEVFGGS